MNRNGNSGKIFFRAGKSIFPGVFFVTYEVTDRDSAKLLFEMYREKLWNPERIHE